MANWRFHGRAKIDPYNPRAVGVCDDCQIKYNHYQLQWQYEYRGNSLMRTGFLKCSTCLDKPYQGNRPILLPADPMPILNPRTEPLLQEENQGTPPISHVAAKWDQANEFWDSNIFWDQA